MLALREQGMILPSDIVRVARVCQAEIDGWRELLGLESERFAAETDGDQGKLAGFSVTGTLPLNVDGRS